MDARNEGLWARHARSLLERIDARITAALWRDVDAIEQRQEEAGGTPIPPRGGAAKDPPGADPYAAPGLREVPTPVSDEGSLSGPGVVSSGYPWDARWLNADGSTRPVTGSEADAIRREFAVGEVVRPCFACGSESNEGRGWVRARLGAPIFWLCNACLDRVPSCRWDGDELVGVSFPGEDGWRGRTS